MSAFIGIDLGTTFSAVSTIDKTGRPLIIHDEDGENIVPSCVSEGDEGQMEVGDTARKTWGVSPERAAARFKRDMGTERTHSINGKNFSPTQLSSFVLKKLLKIANKNLGSVGEAVVTIPANFSTEAREATMTAAKSAGLKVNYIINEPTAAALYYAFKNGEDLHGVYAVYDLGGGTFDVSIIRVDGQDVEVLASNGVSKLGGDDFDKVIIGIVKRKYAQITGDPLDDEDFTLNDAEEEKKSLSKRKSVTLKVNRKLIEISREEFEEGISTLIAQAEMLCESTIEEAGISPCDIREIFLAGGSTRVPLVRESVTRVFGKEPTASVNVDEVVAMGAALYAAYKGDKSKLTETQKHSIGKIRVSESTSKCFGTIAVTYDQHRDQPTLSNSVIIMKGEKIPCSVTESFYTMSDGQTSVACRLTESTAPETDPRFVKIIWEGALELPPGRPEGQEIKVTYAYDENQIMKCAFVDVATNRRTDIDLSMSGSDDGQAISIEQFTVE
ncbi:Hsp70 family protein [Parahaliea maris]|uniref:Hsp70 family protein n=1 Tax=Parahaliea maris TaxID=2716870 RepID=A0A5C8ZR17_9GAMM|nr:Hsp70 family protein [Parahaliea maris]TXS90795.1 Hsp70 family protein [Parahaliea maris]